MKPLYGPVVDEIMSRKVVHVDTSETLAKARQDMTRAGLHKIVVMRGEEPIGILEDWLAERLEEKLQEPNTPIGTALERFGVETAPIRTVPSSTLIDSVKDDFSSYAAVLVIDDHRKIEGIVTVSDLDKLWERV